MNTTSLHIKIDTDVKEEAQKTAEELGLSLSAVVKALLKQFNRTKQLSVRIGEIPNEATVLSLKQSDEDIQAGKVTSFKNSIDALAFLKEEIEKEKQNKHAR